MYGVLRAVRFLRKTISGGLFKYEKNRAILFDINDEVPEKELKAYIELALTYHSIKNTL